MSAQDIIRKSTRWRVGWVSSIKIGQDPWLPDQDNPFIKSNLPDSWLSTTVNFT
ncbi:conserved hypothetical protein [Ricinus communis]|uniref:Uncharacterized protein n=1 Tax=Ricinus communis TaxID=3988 RepID=B9S0P0_RICCO|nr:conserved hypothetical protein [Ricinus communis]